MEKSHSAEGSFICTETLIKFSVTLEDSVGKTSIRCVAKPNGSTQRFLAPNGDSNEKTTILLKGKVFTKDDKDLFNRTHTVELSVAKDFTVLSFQDKKGGELGHFQSGSLYPSTKKLMHGLGPGEWERTFEAKASFGGNKTTLTFEVMVEKNEGTSKIHGEAKPTAPTKHFTEFGRAVFDLPGTVFTRDHAKLFKNTSTVKLVISPLEFGGTSTSIMFMDKDETCLGSICFEDSAYPSTLENLNGSVNAKWKKVRDGCINF